jgi:hypothetical protein
VFVQKATVMLATATIWVTIFALMATIFLVLVALGDIGRESW